MDMRDQLKSWVKLALIVAASSFVLAACGGGGAAAGGGVGIGNSPISASASNVTSVQAPVNTTTLQVAINGQGSVTSNPAGISCNGSSLCSAMVVSGIAVTLNAVPAAGYSFSGWGGVCAGAAGYSCTVTTPVSQVATAAFTSASPNGAPIVLYTDVISGPNSGGENNEGAYLSIFGKNFGNTGLGSTVKVKIGGVEVNNYRYLGPSRGRPDIEQITVQVGSLGNPTPGTPLPIQVFVNGVGSNTDQTFTVNPGRILFVSLNGNKATAIPGDITHPFRSLQNGTNGAFDVMQAGDTIVMRGEPLNGEAITSDPTPASSAWTDIYQGYLLRFISKNGSAPTGAPNTGPLALIAYPNEDVYIYESYASGATGAITGVDTTQWAGGRYVTVADLRIESGGGGGVVNEQIMGDHWRVVNNELTAATGSSDPNNLAGGITGNGVASFWVGNYIHDIQSASPGEMHGIYIDGGGSTGSYEIAYNVIDGVADGSGFQVFVNGGNGSTTASNVVFHHNTVANVAKYGLNVADGTQSGFVYYNNVVYNTASGCLRFNTTTLTGAKFYNNTFYNCNTSGNTYYGAISNDWVFAAGAYDIENNIIYATAGGSYGGGSVGMAAGFGTISHNLYFNAGAAPNWDSSPVTGNPLFVSTVTPDFHLSAGSPAIDAGSSVVSPVVVNDYDITTLRPQGAGYDIGAFEFH